MEARKKENLKSYLFMLPAFIFIGIIYFFPLFQNFRYSFLDLSKEGRPFVGFDNYSLMLKDEIFWVSIRNNFLLLLLIPVLVFLSLIFATLLYEKVKGWKFYRSLILIPYITSITAVGLFFSLFFQRRGILNSFFELINADFLVADWFVNKQLALLTIMFVIIWRELGFGTVLFLARLMTVNDEIVDAAKIDGANWFQRLLHVVVPQLGTVIEFYVFLMITTMISWVFNYVYILTLGAPANSTFVTELYIFIQAFKLHRMGVASAVSIVLFILIGIIAYASYRFRTKLYKAYE